VYVDDTERERESLFYTVLYSISWTELKVKKQYNDATHLHSFLKGTVHLKNSSNVFHHSILIKEVSPINNNHLKKLVNSKK